MLHSLSQIVPFPQLIPTFLCRIDSLKALWIERDLDDRGSRGPLSGFKKVEDIPKDVVFSLRTAKNTLRQALTRLKEDLTLKTQAHIDKKYGGYSRVPSDWMNSLTPQEKAKLPPLLKTVESR